MIRKLLGVPLKMVKRALGRDEKPAAAPPPPVRRSPPPRPAAAAEGDHGHSHGGEGHDHGHSHGGEPKPPPPPPPAEDHGHSHGGHSHGHSHGGEARAAAPAAEVGLDIRVDESETPNPNARKYTCSITVIEKGSASFNTAEEANSHPLGRHIWALGGVKGIFAVKDFVTVTKRDDADWASLSPRMAAAVRRGLVERNATAS
ncbi:hypothetical protein LBMAG42_49290 [Deltaproteobacteria bacterium]|nr:hypothetical protein LBMAG42_49290 [Deltaproteobacteria bacterium]